MKLDEKTSVSVGLAVSLIGGATAWMTSLALQTSANAKSLETIEIRQIKYSESIQNIEKDIAIIKAKADVLISDGRRQGK
jgi:hypothetical protein